MSRGSTRVSDIDEVARALQAIPRVRLGHTPTALDGAGALGRAMGIELLVKRDDCTGLAMGGNKVRQLEFYLGAAKAAGADTVLITGAVQSNFVRLAAAAARCLGMEAHIQLEERVAGGDRIYRTSGNVLLDRMLGARIHHFPVGEDEAAADAELERIAAGLRAQGRRPYVIHLGVDHPPIGALGYVVAAAELVEQARAARQGLDAVVVASGSGLTHSGLLVGLRAAGDPVPVYGICVRRGADLQRPRVLRRVREVESLVGCPGLVDDSQVCVSDAVLAPGYGKVNRETWRAMEMAARLEGLLLDPVYTGKTLAGLMALVDDGTIGGGQRVVFVHTGGQPALFGYQTMLESHLASGDPASDGADAGARR